MYDKNKKYHIYSIRNKINNKRYIGLTNNIERRWNAHEKSKFPIGRAIRKYGYNNFDKRILKKNLTLKQAKKTERFYIAKYNSNNPKYGYNLTGGGDGIFNPTIEIRIKIGKAHRGKKLSKETKKKLKIARNRPETERKRLTTRKKNGTDKFTKKALKNVLKGLKNRPNKKLEIQKAIKTKIKNGYISPIEKRKCANPNCNNSFKCRTKSKRIFCSKSCVVRAGQNLGCKRKPHSKETREKLSKAAKNRKHTEKTKEKIGALQKNLSIKEYRNSLKIETRHCACGCKLKFKCQRRSKQKFIHGHNSVGSHRHHSKATKKLISKNSAMKGKTGNKHHNWIPRETRICACGCNQKFKCRKNSTQKYIYGHNDGNINRRIPREIRTCACGCKQTFECLENSSKKFVHGHNSLGMTRSKESLRKAVKTRRKNGSY